MNTLIGLGELVIFLYLTNRTLKNTDNIIDNVIYCYLCQIFNYRFFDNIPWWSVGINLYPPDFLVVLMLFVLCLKRIQLRKNWFTYLWIIFFFLVLTSMLRGVITFGFTSDFFADFRKYLYFAIGILYFAYIPFKRFLLSFEKKIDGLFIFVSLYVWAGVLLYMAGSSLGTYGNLDRPLLSDYAIIMAAYTTYKWYKALIEECRITFLPIFFTITLIINRFNTTWVALVVAIMVIILLRRIDSRYKKMPKTMMYQMFILIVIVVVAYKLMQNTALFTSVAGNLDKFNLNENNTFSSRVELWLSAIASITGTTLLLGQAMGSGMHVRYRGGLWQATIHNGYLELIFRTGIFGLLSIMLIMIGLIRKALYQRNILIVAIFSIMIVYWSAYNITFEQGMLIGLCANCLLTRRAEYEMDDIS